MKTEVAALFMPPVTLADQCDIPVKVRSDPIRAMYGETFDEESVPLDALKYYAWLAILGQLGMLPLGSTLEIVVADKAVELNKADEWGLARIAELRDRRVQEISSCLDMLEAGDTVNVTLMSDIVATDAYRERRATAEKLLSTSESFRSAIRASVRPDRVLIEEEAGFVYSLDEAALVAGYDLKVGPPRETFYDSAASELRTSTDSKLVQSVLLRPAFPFNVPPTEFVRNIELGRYGVTAYKASSMGFGAQRFVLGRDDLDRFIELAAGGSPVRNAKVPDAMVETSIVLQVVEWAVTREPPEDWLAEQWWSGAIDWAEFCEVVQRLMQALVLDRWHGAGHD